MKSDSGVPDALLRLVLGSTAVGHLAAGVLFFGLLLCPDAAALVAVATIAATVIFALLFPGTPSSLVVDDVLEFLRYFLAAALEDLE